MASRSTSARAGVPEAPPAAAGRPSASDNPPDALVVVRAAPLNAETPPPRLADPITQSANVYVRTNFGVPELPGPAHRIRVDGAVETPFELSVAQLGALDRASVVTTMECAGNDRTAMQPLPDGEPWAGGAVSTARWTGVRLRDLLDRARLTAGVREILLEGADSGRREDAAGVVQFARALPVEAVSPEVILALEMNGAPLTPRHGAPARLVVPGWYGMASVKWVARITALTEPFEGYFQRQRYIYASDAGVQPVTRMRVKSVIVSPENGAAVRRGALTVWGWAWSGDGAISTVEVSRNAGDRWVRARLDDAVGEHAWRRWECELRFDEPGRYVIRCRATDAAGHSQPLVSEWNRLGYGNNAVQLVMVRAV